MKSKIILLLSIVTLVAQSNEEQSFKMKDGTIIVGSIQEETDTFFIIDTKYGTVTLNKDELVQTEYEIKLKSGESFRGIKISETEISIGISNKMIKGNLRDSN